MFICQLGILLSRFSQCSVFIDWNIIQNRFMFGICTNVQNAKYANVYMK